ncbi:MAG: YncE family protein [Terriglobales bacterium]
MKRFLWLGLVLSVYMICSGCGENFRPIIIPNPPTFPNPSAAHTVISINDNPPPLGQTEIVVGTAMVLDVSGDTEISIANVGLAPVHAVQQTATQLLVANHSVTGAMSDSLSKLTFNGLTINTSTTIGLPSDSAPDFVAVAPNQTTVYVALLNTNTVAVISTVSNTQVNTIAVGSQPVAVAVTPDNTKLYVANQGDSTINGINTVDLSQRVGSPVSTSSPPIWLVPRTDSQEVYVLEQNGTLAWLNTTSTAGPDSFAQSSISVPGAKILVYDPNLNRLYIPGGQQMAIVDVSQSAPNLLATIPVPPFTLLNLAPATATATSAAALPDGTRAYVGSYAVLPSQFNVTNVAGDGTTATYAYTLTAGANLTPGVTVTVTGTQQDGFDGTFLVSGIVSGTQACPGTCFQIPNTTNVLNSTPVSATGTGSNVFPQVTVVDAVSNTEQNTIAIPGFPDATNQTYANGLYYVPVCASTRFRFMMAAGGDSTRAYLSSCDGGAVNVIDTSSETYGLSLVTPVGVRSPIPPSALNPPQNPVFLLAGP